MNKIANSLWNWTDLCRALGLPETNGPPVSGFHFDSRLIKKGDLFIPLDSRAGVDKRTVIDSQRDGHRYICHAIENGAFGTLTSKRIASSIPQLFVGDTFEAMWNLAGFRRKQLRSPVVAVTGSSGKTTFQHFLASILKIPPIEGSFNNHIGVPLSLARTPVNARFAILELGTNHSGEIAPLSQLTKPDVAVLLNILEAHIGNFTSFAALAQEKFAITSGLSEHGIFVLPHSLSAHECQSWEKTYLTFGFEEDADLRIQHIENNRYHFSSTSDEIAIEVPGGGDHRAQTLGACAAVLLALHIPLKSLQTPTLVLPSGRGKAYSINGITVIDDSYNANPSSVQEALKLLQETKTDGRSVAVIGQMNELGDKSTSYHKNLNKYIKNIDFVYCVGDLAFPLYEILDQNAKSFYRTADENLMHELVRELSSGDVVLVKGSNAVFWQNNFVERLLIGIRDGDSGV